MKEKVERQPFFFKVEENKVEEIDSFVVKEQKEQAEEIVKSFTATIKEKPLEESQPFIIQEEKTTQEKKAESFILQEKEDEVQTIFQTLLLPWSQLFNVVSGGPRSPTGNSLW